MTGDMLTESFGDDWPVAAGLTGPASRPAEVATLLAADAARAWESAIASVLEDGESLAILGRSAAADRAAEAAEEMGIRIVRCEGTARATRLGALLSALSGDRHGDIGAVLVADGTGTGEIAAARAVIDHAFHDALLMANCEGPGAATPPEGIEIDIAVTRIGGETGAVGRIALSKAAQAAAARRWYAARSLAPVCLDAAE